MAALSDTYPTLSPSNQPTEPSEYTYTRTLSQRCLAARFNRSVSLTRLSAAPIRSDKISNKRRKNGAYHCPRLLKQNT